MRKLLSLLALAFAVIACESKDDDQPTTADQFIKSVSFYCANSGSNISQGVRVDFHAPAGSVKRLSLYHKSSTTELFYISNPESGIQRLFNHGSDCDRTPNPNSYYFVIAMADGSKLTSGTYPK